MSKHTPGPWVARDATFPTSGVIRWVVLETDNGFTLADTGNADTPKHQDEANARLIAAAPDLLNALKLCFEELDRHKARGHGVSELALGLAEQAIAKAEGMSESVKNIEQKLANGEVKK